jgi:hypothetical protein
MQAMPIGKITRKNSINLTSQKKRVKSKIESDLMAAEQK